ncbi:hypothetical protein H5410_064965 [Solanum commersonii]|uniref:Uncharacterized protein n=1 Tax=Solanum commersonii TaxID=4109 RepID=A0A9J5VXU8_SOLCO|nr:hypothetical protein H5410_064965 [Solanum commersonii]
MNLTTTSHCTIEVENSLIGIFQTRALIPCKSTFLAPAAPICWLIVFVVYPVLLLMCRYVEDGTLMNNYGHIFSMIARLRQAADHR